MVEISVLNIVAWNLNNTGRNTGQATGAFRCGASHSQFSDRSILELNELMCPGDLCFTYVLSTSYRSIRDPRIIHLTKKTHPNEPDRTRISTTMARPNGLQKWPWNQKCRYLDGKYWYCLIVVKLVLFLLKFMILKKKTKKLDFENYSKIAY